MSRSLEQRSQGLGLGLGLGLLKLLGRSTHHIGIDRAGSHRVHADILRP